MLHIGDVRAAEGVDRLIVVADRENRGVRACEQLQPLVLQHVGVLEFVDQDVREAAPIVLAQRIVARQELVGSQQELGEVDHPFALARLLVQSVMFDLPAAEIVECLDLVRTQAFLL